MASDIEFYEQIEKTAHELPFWKGELVGVYKYIYIWEEDVYAKFDPYTKKVF